jgi:DNA-binding NarL/FixJ family response regulator
VSAPGTLDALDGTTVHVAGGLELTRQLLGQVLRDAGAEVVDTIGAAVLVVLIDPDEEHWTPVRETDRPVVLLHGGPCDALELLELVERGVVGALPLASETADILAAVRRVAGGDVTLSRTQTRDLCEVLRRRRLTAVPETVKLTPREVQILRSIEAGELMKQTARNLGISPRTVENTQRVLFRKLGVRNRAQAIARAYALSILQPHEESVR